MADLISVIVPVYNSAQYICDCVRSVMNQTYRDLELILIDDGSKDGGIALCGEKYGADERIHFVRQEHKGVSAARNAGIEAATGDYLFFLDSDDIIHPQLLEMLYMLLVQHGSAIATEGRYCAEGELLCPADWETSAGIPENAYLSHEKALNHLIQGYSETALHGIGGKMIRRAAVASMRFDEDLTHGEDTWFLYQLIDKGADASVLYRSWYYYRKHEEGAASTFSVRTCSSRYKAEAYIRSKELENGRAENAVIWENAIISALSKWYKVARQNGDHELTQYLKGLAEEERGMDIFSHLSWRKRTGFRLLFYNYVLYLLFTAVVPVWEKAVAQKRKAAAKAVRIRYKVIVFYKRARYKLLMAVRTAKYKMEARVKRWIYKIIVAVKTVKYKTGMAWKAVKYTAIWLLTKSGEENKIDSGDEESEEGWDKMSTGKKIRVGIITFHCSDNYGAMLQAYGLKKYLRNQGIKADIVRYEPPFLTGRHWWIPYVPMGDFRKTLRYCERSWKWHVGMGMDFFKLRASMKRFRRKNLVNRTQRKRWFSTQLRGLPYSCYIVGSDQIWNPDITLGLRKVYFGAFQNRRKERVIAYAASLGGSSLPEKYDSEFSELLRQVDAVSVREEAAIPYIEKFYEREVKAVLDPVFLLREREWEAIEKEPGKAGYILVYLTENNLELLEYTKKMSQEKGLPVVELRAGRGVAETEFWVDYTAGPAEFLGYIHYADYVVTNSFHAVALSIIFRKRFLAFLHSNRGERIRNILKIHGLENRLWQAGKAADIDMPTDWEAVKRKTGENMKESEKYLMTNILQGKEK